MNNILYKELKLSASLLCYIFIIFGLMFLIPGYPILCGAFFVSLGIFRNFQDYLLTNDIVFSALLPIKKKDIVKGKFIFVCFIELCSILLMSVCVLIRNTLLVDSLVYRNNFMMNANLYALAMAFVIYAIFNLIYVAGFFKTTYKSTWPFIWHMIITFLIIGLAETLIHMPGLAFLNAFGKDYINAQLLILLIGITLYFLITLLAYKISCKRFERIDL